MPDEGKDGWAPDQEKDGWAADETPASAPPAPPAADENADNARLQELIARRSAAGGQAVKMTGLPPALANLTPKELKEKVEGVARGVVTVVAAWVIYSLVGQVASLAIDQFVLHRAAGLTAKDLWTAQALLAAPYVLLAFLGGLVVKGRTALPRQPAWMLALSVVYVIIRLARFRWCGPQTASGDALITRVADAATVFAAAQLGYAGARRRPRTEADRFGPGPIEP